jgi:DNA-binding NarL/FixJ family response regulator
VTIATRYRLIVADDHQHVAHSLRALLEPDYDVVDVVEDGSLVVPSVARHRPDGILLDLWLPGRNGLDILTELHRDHPEVKVVILTMHADVVVAVEAMNRGAQGYLLKDSGYAELDGALKAVFGGATYLSPRVTGETMTTLFRDRFAR